MKKRLPARLISKVDHGTIRVPRGVHLAEGATVEIIPLDPLPRDSAFLKGMLKLAKPRNWPKDFALNHGHYTKGYPKR